MVLCIGIDVTEGTYRDRRRITVRKGDVMATDEDTFADEDVLGDGNPTETRDRDANQADGKTTSPSQQPEPRLWKNQRYVHWLVADTASLVGSALCGLAFTYVSYGLTHSIAVSGALTSIGGIVSLLVMMFGGTFVDRHPRKRLVMIQGAINVVVWAVVAVLLIGGWLTFPIFATLYLANCVVGGLFGEATNALLRSVVSTVEYPKAQSINQGRDSAVDVVGSPLGGLLYGVATWVPFLAEVVCGVLAVIAASRIDVDESSIARSVAARSQGNPVKDFAHDFIEGWRWLLATKRLPTIIIMLCLFNFSSVGISKGVSLYLVGNHTSAFMLGVFNGAQSVFSILGALVSARLSSRLRVGWYTTFTAAAIAAVMIPLIWLHSYPAMLALMCLGILAMPLLNAMMLGFVFAKTPQELQGRINVCFAFPGSLIADCSGAVIGWCIERFGFGHVIAIWVLPLVVAVVLCAASPRIRTIPAAAHWDDTEI